MLMKLSRILLTIVLTVFLLAAAVGEALAHAVPLTSVPAANTIVASAPEELRIQFNEPIVPELSRIDLLTQAGQRIETGALAPGNAENSSLVLPLPPLDNGTYLVSWQVLSAVDGHTTTGTYSFGIGVASLAGVVANTQTAAQIDPLSATARWLSLTAIVLLLGLFSFRPLLWLPARPAGNLPDEYAAVDQRIYHAGLIIAWLAVALLIVASLLTLTDQVTTYQLFSGNNLVAWLSTRFGWMWLARLIVTLILAAILGRIRGFPTSTWDPLWWAGLVLASLLAVTASMISHSAALLQDSLNTTLTDLVHLLAAGIWGGGLVQLALAAWYTRELAADKRTTINLRLIIQFSLLAGLSVGLLMASGSYLTSVHVSTWTALFGTTYGRILLAKLGLMLPLLLLAAINLLYIKPRLRQASAEGPAAPGILRRFSQYVRAEAVLAFLIILAAGFLTDAQRGADAPLLADEGGRAVLQQQVEDLTFTMTIEPALVGNNVFDIAVTDAAGQPVTDVSEMDLRFTFLEQSLGASEAVPEEIDTGLYRLEGAFISLIGEWQVEVAVRRPGSYDAFAPYRLNAGLGGTIQDAQAERNLWDSLASTTTLLNNAIIGFGLVLLGLIWFGFSFRVADSRIQLIPLLAFSLAAFWFGGQQLNTFFGTEYTPSKFLNNPVLPDQASIQQGQVVFEAECASCHGIQGLGNGEAALGLNPAPANFTDGHTDAHSDGDLFFWIRNGKEGTAMPAFGEQYSETESWHIVNYVRRLSQQ